MHPSLRHSRLRVESTITDPVIRTRLARYIRGERRFWRRAEREGTHTLIRPQHSGRLGYAHLRAEFMAITVNGTL